MMIKSKINKELEEIAGYLKAKGCVKIILFGSHAERRNDKTSDVDIAVSGIDSKKFFTAIADLPIIVKKKVDLVDLEDLPDKIIINIEENGIVLYGDR